MIIKISFLVILTFANIISERSKDSYLTFQVPTQNHNYFLLISINKTDGLPYFLIISRSGALPTIDYAIENGTPFILYYAPSAYYKSLSISLSNPGKAEKSICNVKIKKLDGNEIEINPWFNFDNFTMIDSTCVYDERCLGSQCNCKAPNSWQLSFIDQFDIELNTKLDLKFEINEWQFFSIKMQENHNILNFEFAFVSGIIKIYSIIKNRDDRWIQFLLYEEIIEIDNENFCYILDLSDFHKNDINIGFHCESLIGCFGNLNLTSQYKQVSSRVQLKQETPHLKQETPQLKQETPIPMFIICIFLLILLCAILSLKNYIKNRGSVWKEIEKNYKMTKWVTTDKSNIPLCVICLDIFTKECRVKILPCQHIFHKCCLDPWFKNKFTCPICKCNIKTN